MKNRLLFCTFLATCTLSGAPAPATIPLEYEEPIALCIGDIVFHTDIDPDLCLYYKGNKLKLDINHDKKSKKLGLAPTPKELVKIVPYTLQEAKATQEFYLLICHKPEFASDSNTITYLHVPHTTAYKLYKLSADRKYDEEGQVIGCQWKVTEQALADKRIVPDNSVIFLFNADFVDGVQVKSWPLNSNIRLLPSIVINKNISPDDIVQAIIQARMIALDFDTIHHRHAKNATKIESKTVVMIQP